MTPKEKAEELVGKFKQYSYYDAHDLTTRVKREESNTESTIECAIIAVDEVLSYIDGNHNGYYTMPENIKVQYDYYEEVKQELENM